MAKLMLIAVDVATGTIKEPVPGDPKPRVVGIDSADFENFIANLPTAQKQEPNKAKDGIGKHPYFDDTPPRPQHVATILQTHHSPGCTWVIINGWPFCIS
jgi:hypothetical protein